MISDLRQSIFEPKWLEGLAHNHRLRVRLNGVDVSGQCWGAWTGNPGRVGLYAHDGKGRPYLNQHRDNPAIMFRSGDVCIDIMPHRYWRSPRTVIHGSATNASVHVQ